jgi:hypothetical protein
VPLNAPGAGGFGKRRKEAAIRPIQTKIVVMAKNVWK